MYDALKDEVWDQQSTSIELRQQLEEYEETIEYLYDKIDNMQSDFDSIISYVDLYYEKEISDICTGAIVRQQTQGTEQKL